MRPANTLIKFHRFGGAGNARAEYQDVAGQARPFIAKDPAKYWEDPDAPDDPKVTMTYKRLPTAGEPPSLVSFTLTGAQARHVNLPGLSVYTPYFPAPTSAMVGGSISARLINPDVLSTMAEAMQIKGEIGGENISYDMDEGGLTIIYGSETRRVWVVLRKGARLNVGLLIKDKWTAGLTETADSSGFNVASGVGSPGHWDLIKTQPKWVPDRLDLGTGISNQLPEVPEPVRDLAPGESLVLAGAMGNFYIQTAEEAAAGAANPTGNVAALPVHFNAEWAEVVATLAKILAALTKAGIG